MGKWECWVMERQKWNGKLVEKGELWEYLQNREAGQVIGILWANFSNSILQNKTRTSTGVSSAVRQITPERFTDLIGDLSVTLRLCARASGFLFSIAIHLRSTIPLR
ncbi:hypothetical protein HAX54_042792 [Datura stramonium]|uniref:Uncharacterized protein n=1 Tax=Datura stramonium TaxID=4076 RepID=A0ABS8VZY3_DATST|nr:hypothetical protein [Datura stramonium]